MATIRCFCSICADSSCTTPLQRPMARAINRAACTAPEKCHRRPQAAAFVPPRSVAEGRLHRERARLRRTRERTFYSGRGTAGRNGSRGEQDSKHGGCPIAKPA